MKFGGLQCEVVNGELVFQLTPLNERKIYTMSKNKLFAAHIRRIPLLNGQTTLGLTLQGIILFLQQSRNVKVEKSFWNAINQTIINSLNSKKSVYVQAEIPLRDAWEEHASNKANDENLEITEYDAEQMFDDDNETKPSEDTSSNNPTSIEIAAQPRQVYFVESSEIESKRRLGREIRLLRCRKQMCERMLKSKNIRRKILESICSPDDQDCDDSDSDQDPDSGDDVEYIFRERTSTQRNRDDEYSSSMSFSSTFNNHDEKNHLISKTIRNKHILKDFRNDVNVIRDERIFIQGRNNKPTWQNKSKNSTDTIETEIQTDTIYPSDEGDISESSKISIPTWALQLIIAFLFNKFTITDPKSILASRFYNTQQKNETEFIPPKLEKRKILQKLTGFNPFKDKLNEKFPLKDTDYITYNIYRYDPSKDESPYIQTFYLKKGDQDNMLLGNLFFIKDNFDEGLAFRKSCREGICGSCGVNVNGRNVLACLYVISDHVSQLHPVVDVYPLPHLPVVRDLVVDMKHFYNQYNSIDPWLKYRSVNDCAKPVVHGLDPKVVNNLRITVSGPEREIYQSVKDRKLLDGLYECILCACCTTSCPSYWWNREKYLGPTILMQAYRWIIDTRDDYALERLKQLDDQFKLYRCHVILNCVKACPKKLNPAEAIANAKDLVHIMHEMHL